MSQLVFRVTDYVGAVLEGRQPYTEELVDQTVNGKEIRSTYWTYPRYRYTVRFEFLRSDARFDHQALLNLFSRLRGPHDDFLLVDTEDNSVTDHGFGVGDGATTGFQLQRTMLGASYPDALGSYVQSTKPRTNFCLQSQALTVSPWTSTSALVTDNTAVAPDGTATATLINEGVATAQHYATQSPVLVAGVRYTVSVFVKAGSNTSCRFGWNDGNGLATFDLANGVVSAPPTGAGTASIVASAGGWWRITVGYTAAASGALALLLMARDGTSYAGTSNTFFAWGVQAETGTVATQYIPTTTVAVTVNPSYWPGAGDGFEPIFDLNGPISVFLDNDWRGKRQLFPWQRTNQAAFSEQLDNAAWTKTNATIVANATAAPDGNATADQFNEGTAVTVTHLASQPPTTAEAAGELRCYSVYLKAGTLPNISIQDGLGGVNVNFDFVTGTIPSVGGNVLASGLTALPNGWYRVWMVKRVSTLGGKLIIQGQVDATYSFAAYTGTSRTFFAWGAQMELVSNLLGPTEYIPTPSSAAVSKTDYTLSSTGFVTFTTAPLANAWLSWSGSFFRRVRFADASLPLDRIVSNLWTHKGAGLVSVKV